ncbi:hypothetical protein DICPUDRAFT_160252 [Dictyostelium purpureum]|uniref:Uncharacterized protein n=1 Tax=Dictyostelium purpureum TaxID=5786 RepID=F1A603_DICPU|nr:uncharacterized protein DICPUDRAFT_160252 [Dictyostelium purpureum]EGC28374.1 hypothetical protein DICPUDRAFT_160252 [Dictyostelium purpureum]|eukprot:XP_003295097.1 hypothetical protein DICPUDRAFT_160252 [Dictyostelium purpureum]
MIFNNLRSLNNLNKNKTIKTNNYTANINNEGIFTSNQSSDLVIKLFGRPDYQFV